MVKCLLSSMQNYYNHTPHTIPRSSENQPSPIAPNRYTQQHRGNSEAIKRASLTLQTLSLMQSLHPIQQTRNTLFGKLFITFLKKSCHFRLFHQRKLHFFLFKLFRPTTFVTERVSSFVQVEQISPFQPHPKCNTARVKVVKKWQD